MVIYTNTTTDLACIVYKTYWWYDDGSIKAKYKLYNKRNGIIYETKNSIIHPNLFKWCEETT